MKAEEKLYLAIGEIDDDIIEEASFPAKRMYLFTPRKMSLVATIALVTIIVIVSVGLLSLPTKNDMNNMGGNSNKFDGAPEDNVTNSSPLSAGYISSVNKSEENSYEFTLTITKSGFTNDVHLLGTKSDSDGTKVYVYTTSNDFSNDENTVYYTPVITVNGERAERLPSNVGTYSIKISFDSCDVSGIQWNDYFTIDNIGEIRAD